MAEDTTPVLPDEGDSQVVEDDGSNLLVDADEVTKESKETVTDLTTEPESKEEDKEEKPAKDSEETEDKDEPEEKVEDKPDEESKDEPEVEPELDPKELARRDYRERQAAKRQLDQELDNQWRTQTPEELEELGVDPAEAKIDALNQKIEFQNFKQQVTETNYMADQETMEIFQEFDFFRPPTEDKPNDNYDRELSAKALRRWEQSARVEYNDPVRKDYIVRADFGPYEVFKEFADVRQGNVTRGKVEGQRAAEKNLAAAEPASRNQTTETPDEEDPFLKGFNKGSTDY